MDFNQKKLLDSFSDLVFLLDAKGYFLYINKEKHKHLLGSRDEHIGKPIYYCVLEDDQEKLKAAIKQINEGSIEEDLILVVPIPAHFRVNNQEYMYLSCQLSPFEKEGNLTILVVIREVSEWVHKLDNHMRMQKQEKKALELFYKNSGLAITTLDLNFNILDITGTFDEFSKKEVIGKNIQEFHTREIWQEKVKPVYEKVIKTQEALSYESSYEKDNKTQCYLEIVTPLFNEDNLSGLMLGSKKQNRLEHASLLMSHIDGMIAQIQLKNNQLKMVYLSDGASKMLGESHAHFLRADFNYLFKLIHPNELDVFKKGTEESIASKSGWDRKGRFLIDNKVIHFHSRSSITEKEDGSLLITTLTLDITKEKQLEETNSALGQELTQLIDTANAPIFGVDINGNINEWNQKAAEITGFSKVSVLGKSLVDEFISDAYKIPVQEVLNCALKGIETSNYELPLITKAGKRVMVLLNATTRRNVSGEILGVVGVGQDITERKHLENLVQEKTDQFELIENASADMIAIINLDMEFMYVSPRCDTLYGYSQNELLGQRPGFYVLEHFRPSVESKMDKLQQDENYILVSEHQVRKKTGEIVWHQVKATKSKDANFYIGITRDITKEKQLEETNSALGQELTQLIDTANAPIFGVDINGNINEWNQKAAEITGFSKVSVLGKSLVDEFISDAYKIPVQEVLNCALIGIETSNYELPLMTKSGERVMVLLNATTRRNVKGEILGVVGVGQDITEIDEVRDKIRTQNRLFCDLEDFSDTFSWEIDLKKNVLWWSDKGYDLVKVNKDQVLSPDFFMSLLTDEMKIKVEACMDNLFSTKRSQDMELSFKHLPDRVFYESKHLILDDAGEPIKVCGQMQDITEKKRLKEALDQAKQESIIAEEQNKLKTEFMSNMSHELRTPLNAIMGFSQLLDKQIPGKLNQKQSRYISNIYDGGRHLLALIEDILNLDKCEANQLELQIEKIYLDDYLCDAMDNFRELASKKEIDIHFNNQVKCCHADTIRLTQMLYNLISNAIKFSKENTTIYITIQNTKEYTEFLIRDEGCGIDKKHQKTIFEKFKQLENPFTKLAEGTGLGLPLAKAFAQAHGGDLILDQSHNTGKNQGSTFKLSIPC